MSDREDWASGREVIIIGAGGTGVDAVECLERVSPDGSPYQCLGFLDDDPAKRDAMIGGLRVLGPLSRAAEWKSAWFVNALGSPHSYRNRPAITASTGLPVARFVTLIDPSAHVSARSRIGRGVIVYPNVVIGPNARIGDFVTILANTVINHDVSVGAWTIVASGVNVSGAVEIGACCYLGSGAALKERVRIGPGALIGLGAAVIRDVPADAIVAGNPAALLSSTNKLGAEHR